MNTPSRFSMQKNLSSWLFDVEALVKYAHRQQSNTLTGIDIDTRFDELRYMEAKFSFHLEACVTFKLLFVPMLASTCHSASVKSLRTH